MGACFCKEQIYSLLTVIHVIGDEASCDGLEQSYIGNKHTLLLSLVTFA